MESSFKLNVSAFYLMKSRKSNRLLTLTPMLVDRNYNCVHLKTKIEFQVTNCVKFNSVSEIPTSVLAELSSVNKIMLNNKPEYRDTIISKLKRNYNITKPNTPVYVSYIIDLNVQKEMNK